MELIALCAGLPIALAVVAARAAAAPSHSLAALTEDLRDTRGLLDALDDGDAATSARAVFSWSYRNLSDPAARMFRLVGVHHPGRQAHSRCRCIAAFPVEHPTKGHLPRRRSREPTLSRSCSTKTSR